MLRIARASLRRASLGFFAALVAATLVVAPSASADTGGSISGTVRYGDTGAPAVGVDVTAWLTDPETGQGTGYGGTTDANGQFTIDVGYQDAASGTYSFEVPWPYGPYKYYVATAPADYFTYTQGQDVTGPDVLLQRFPAVSGTVVDSLGAPVGGGSLGGSGVVTLFRTDNGDDAGSSQLELGSDGKFFIDTSTIGAGRYTVSAMPGPESPAGETSATTWLGGSPTMAAATTFYLNPGDVRALPQIGLLAGSTISGHVEATTLDLPGWVPAKTATGSVELFDANAPHSAAYQAEPDSDGNYSVMGVSSGDYTVVFRSAGASYGECNGQNGQWWSGSPGAPVQSPTAAKTVKLGIGDSLTGVDATLTEGGSTIRGVVQDASGTPREGVPVLISASDGSVVDRCGTHKWAGESDYGTLFQGPEIGLSRYKDPTLLTEADGSFSVSGIAAGTYDVYLGGGADWSPLPGGEIASSFHDGARFAEDSAGVTVDGTTETDLGAISVSPGGSISGTLNLDSSVVREADYQYSAAMVAFAYNGTAGRWEVVETADVHDFKQGSTYKIEGLAAGAYKVGFFDYQRMAAGGHAATMYGDTLDLDLATTVTVAAGQNTPGIDFGLSAIGPVDQTRYSGADRYATSIAISQTFSPGVSVAYVASGENFPDALAAAPAAAGAGGPLLITRSTSLPAAVKAELERLEPTEIVLVGGTGAVSRAVYDELSALAGSGGVKRVFGADRYATARAIVEDHWDGKTVERVYIASGQNFPDALSAAAAAGAMGVPVITVEGSAAHLDPAVAALVQSLGATDVAVAGGTGAVSEGIVSDLTEITGVEEVWRYAGANRYATGFSVNHDAFSGSDLVYVASGQNFPDALSGAAIAGRDKAPLYIVPGYCITESVADDIRNFGATKVTVLGGSAVVSVDLSEVTICS